MSRSATGDQPGELPERPAEHSGGRDSRKVSPAGSPHFSHNRMLGRSPPKKFSEKFDLHSARLISACGRWFDHTISETIIIAFQLSPYRFHPDFRSTAPVRRLSGPVAVAALALARRHPKDCPSGKVVLDTGWREKWGQASYFSEHPLISGGSGEVYSRMRSSSDWRRHAFGGSASPFEAHLEFLGNNIVIVENLANLEQIRGDVFELIAFPLKLKAREASPVRAIAMEID